MYGLPSEFKVANMTWKVEFVKVLESGNYGELDTARQVITVATHHSESRISCVALTEEQITNTYWHEVFHLFNWLWNTETDECLAQSFSNMMCEYNATKKE